MDIYDENIKIIADYIREGFKHKRSDNIGAEFEHFIVHKNSGESVKYFDGVDKILERIQPRYEHSVYSDGYLISLYNDDYSITLEPAGQIEISIRPLDRISKIERIYNEFLSLLLPVLDDFGYEIARFGYQPKSHVDDLPIIPKKRYEYMDRYFKTTGTCGKHMMRGTASAQMSVDFTDEADCIAKYRLACILGPVFALISDNSPVFDGVPYKKHMLRTYIWDNVDKDRCNVFPNVFESDFNIRAYAEHIYNLPAILITEGDKTTYTGNAKIRDIYRNKLLTRENVEHIMSMFFPDSRLKQYIEIRNADCMPEIYNLAYAAFIKGIFTDISGFDFSHVTVFDIDAAKKSLIENGFNGIIYGEKAYSLVDRLYRTAEAALDAEERRYLAPLGEIISSRKTLKEMLKWI